MNPRDAESEAKYTNICARIAHVYEHYLVNKQRILSIRKERQSLYFLVMFFMLAFFAYVGQCVDNFFLTYVIVLVVTLTPGARRHNLKDKLVEQVRHLLSMKRAVKKLDWFDSNTVKWSRDNNIYILRLTNKETRALNFFSFYFKHIYRNQHFLFII